MTEYRSEIFINFLKASVKKTERNKVDDVDDLKQLKNSFEKIVKAIEKGGIMKTKINEFNIIKINYIAQNFYDSNESKRKQIEYHEPPLKFPNKTGYKCVACESKETGHQKGCLKQLEDLLVVDKDYLKEKYKKSEILMEKSKLEDLLKKEFIFNCDISGNIKIKDHVFNRLTITVQEDNEKEFNIEIYSYFFIKVFGIHLKKNNNLLNWEDKAESIIEFINNLKDSNGNVILNEYVDKQKFDEDSSFIQNIRIYYREVEKDNLNFNIRLNLEAIKKQLKENLEKNLFIVYNDTGKNKNIQITKYYEYNEKQFEYLNEARNFLDLDEGNKNFCEATFYIFLGGGMNVLLTEKADDKGIYNNILLKYTDIKDKIPTLSSCIKYIDQLKKEITKIVFPKDEPLSLIFIQGTEKLKNSVKHLTWDSKEPAASDEEIRCTSPLGSIKDFMRGIVPYGFKYGELVYPDHCLDFRGKKIGYKNRTTGEIIHKYYPVTTNKTKSTDLVGHKHIYAKLVGFPKDEDEAEKWGIKWNNGWEKNEIGNFIKIPEDTSSAIAKGNPGWSRVIKPLLNEEERKKITNKLNNKNLSRNDLKSIFLNSIKEKEYKKIINCVMKKLGVPNDGEFTEEIIKDFPKPLTIENLLKICNTDVCLKIIPKNAIITCIKNRKMYFSYEDEYTPFKLYKRKSEEENSIGYIYKKEFIPLKFEKKTNNVLNECIRILKKEDKQLIFMTKEKGCYYWSSKGYGEINCECRLNHSKKIEIKINGEYEQIVKDKEIFPLIKYNNKGITEIEKFSPIDKMKEIRVRGKYNNFGQIYPGKVMKKISKDEMDELLKKMKELDLKNLKVGDVEKKLEDNNFKNFLHTQHPITRFFFTQTANVCERIICKYKFPFTQQEPFKSKIKDYFNELLNKKNLVNDSDSLILFYDGSDGNIQYFYKCNTE